MPALLVFVGLFAIYLLNGGFLHSLDAKGNVAVAISLLNEGDFSIAKGEVPFAFNWEGGKGDRTVIGTRKFLAPTIYEGVYVGTFGPGAAVASLPVLGPLHLLWGDLLENRRVLWFGAKVAASLFVAGTGMLIFLTAGFLVGRKSAVLAALTYGLATCAWTLSSQALWQQTPNQFFLALGTYFLIRSRERRFFAVACGLAYACAVCCRPTSVLFVVAAGIYFVVRDRRSLLPFFLAGLPFAVALGAYNDHFHGSPLTIGHTVRAERSAMRKTGSRELWQAPWEGAAGLMVSPSRGLLVYSPVMGFAFWGMFLARRQRRREVLEPLAGATLFLMLVQFSWHDWWGGYSYGYRPLLDTLPALSLFLALAIERCLDRRLARAALYSTLAWSVFVQALGALSYNGASWNANPSVDKNQHRLWQVRDSQIEHHLRNYSEARRLKKRRMRSDVEASRERASVTNRRRGARIPRRRQETPHRARPR